MRFPKIYWQSLRLCAKFPRTHTHTLARQRSESLRRQLPVVAGSGVICSGANLTSSDGSSPVRADHMMMMVWQAPKWHH